MASEQEHINELMDHLFRHEAGRMVSVLTRVFGLADIQLAEDTVQESIFQALMEWPFRGVPDDPRAWLYRVARNKAIDALRRQQRRKTIYDSVGRQALLEWNMAQKMEDLFLEHEIQDSQLRMIFTCCHPAITQTAQVALTLKTLCGFSVKEIAKAFLSNEETINKRLVRARQKMREQDIKLEIPGGQALAQRLSSVLKALYLMFNEGYNATVDDALIRRDVCLEAMRLCQLLTEYALTALPETQALLALMCFHAARFDARLDEKGCPVLLKDQDRSLWNKTLIQEGFRLLDESSRGDRLTTYHMEAAILSIHCSSISYEVTNWPVIAHLYEQLYTIHPTPVVRLNHAVAQAQVWGPQQAIAYILAGEPMESFYLYHAVLGDLYQQTDAPFEAIRHLEKALILTESPAEKLLLQKKLGAVREAMAESN